MQCCRLLFKPVESTVLNSMVTTVLFKAAEPTVLFMHVNSPDAIFESHAGSLYCSDLVHEVLKVNDCIKNLAKELYEQKSLFI